MSGDGRTLAPAVLKAVAGRLDPAARLVGHRRLEGGVSATMTALDLERADGRRDTVILRLPGLANLAFDPDSAAHEHRLLGLLAAYAIPAPEPLMLDTARDLVAMDYLVVGWLDGAVTVDQVEREPAASAMAEFLVRVHAVPDHGAIAFLPEQGDLFDLLAGEVAPDHPVAFTPPVQAALGRLRPAFPATRSVLLHGDFWPGNMLWRDGLLVAALDWEDAARGDPLYDLAVARLDIAFIWGLSAMETFTARYLAMTGRDDRALPLWDLVATRRAPADYADWAQDWSERGRPDITAATMAAARRAVATAALARVAAYLQAAAI